MLHIQRQAYIIKSTYVLQISESIISTSAKKVKNQYNKTLCSEHTWIKISLSYIITSQKCNRNTGTVFFQNWSKTPNVVISASVHR